VGRETPEFAEGVLGQGMGFQDEKGMGSVTRLARLMIPF
jgi:hypothetical protein